MARRNNRSRSVDRRTTAGSATGADRRAALAESRAAAARAQRRNRVITIVLAVVLVVGVGIGALVWFKPAAPTAAPSPTAGAGAAGAAVVRADSHRISDAPAGSPTFVEFLDFECEACRAAYPTIEQLRQTYGDRVQFVVRYFPLEGHVNAMRAARAVEAAAQQGKFVAMYQKMYETQAQWGEQQVPKDDVFRQFAVDLGLDMTAWDAAYAAEATTRRIQADVDDGVALGVSGTPSFFLDGQRLEPRSVEDLRAAIDQALVRQ